MKILNLYAGIGGNRKLWTDRLKNGERVEITAVELNPDIAKIYKSFFPADNVIVGDAHAYLLEHFREYDFIWSSPPCQTHSRLYHTLSVCSGKAPPRYADMSLYQEIILLRKYCRCRWIVENVAPYYGALISPTFCLQRHFFWSNCMILERPFPSDNIQIRGKYVNHPKTHGFDVSKFDFLNQIERRTVLRNCLAPEVGLYIFEQIFRDKI